ncbi:MAG TPA: DUF349 domain-containing protein [Chitinophagaceae bacterium]|nr:DUF349 domain-containing protein [Chitinophagaceae bacterium]
MSETQLYFVRDENVFLPANKWFEERSIAELPDSNHQYIIASLEDRFQELFEKVNEVKKDFEAASDKIKLAGKIVRTKSYLCTAKAIGDYTTLLTVLDTMEEEIKVEVEKAIAQKEKLCLEAEELLKATEWKDATEKLRQLQVEFKATPSVPDLKNEEFRERFEKAKDDFFKGKQASFENFELDLLDNLSKKIDLCEKAESLQHSTEWKKTTDLYIALNEEWKKIGMVPKHRVEELWFRFCAAKDIFFAKKKEHIGDIVVEQEENLVKKLELVAKAESIKESKQWKETADEYAKLMEDWKKIGKVPQERSDEVWNAFLAAKNYFYDQKNHHFSKIKVQLEDNHARKMAIVNHAEELQNSMDFESATTEFMDMFDEWKKIGRVPKEYGDEAWERFQKAKKTFFDRKDENREKRKLELSKDIKDRYERNRSYYAKISRELQREEELLFDMNDRIENLPVTLRSYEKREEYLEVMEEIKAKVNELKEKAKEVKEKMYMDEREMSQIMRGPRKKEHQANEQKKQNQPKKEKEAAVATDTPSTEKVNEEKSVEPILESVTTPTAEVVADSITEAAPEPVVENKVEPIAEPAAEVKIEEMVESVSEVISEEPKLEETVADVSTNEENKPII